MMDDSAPTHERRKLINGVEKRPQTYLTTHIKGERRERKREISKENLIDIFVCTNLIFNKCLMNSMNSTVFYTF